MRNEVRDTASDLGPQSLGPQIGMGGVYCRCSGNPPQLPNSFLISCGHEKDSVQPLWNIHGGRQQQEKGELRQDDSAWARAMMAEVIRRGLAKFRTKLLEDRGTKDTRDVLRIRKYLKMRIQRLGHDIMMH